MPDGHGKQAQHQGEERPDSLDGEQGGEHPVRDERRADGADAPRDPLHLQPLRADRAAGADEERCHRAERPEHEEKASDGVLDVRQEALELETLDAERVVVLLGIALDRAGLDDAHQHADQHGDLGPADDPPAGSRGRTAREHEQDARDQDAEGDDLHQLVGVRR